MDSGWTSRSLGWRVVAAVVGGKVGAALVPQRVSQVTGGVLGVAVERTKIRCQTQVSPVGRCVTLDNGRAVGWEGRILLVALLVVVRCSSSQVVQRSATVSMVVAILLVACHSPRVILRRCSNHLATMRCRHHMGRCTTRPSSNILDN